MNSRSSSVPIHDGWNDLANAIILRAAEDYRLIRIKLQKEADKPELLEQKAEIEDFFHSNWFSLLTSLNGQQLLCRLQSELKDTEGNQ